MSTTSATLCGRAPFTPYPKPPLLLEVEAAFGSYDNRVKKALDIYVVVGFWSREGIFCCFKVKNKVAAHGYLDKHSLLRRGASELIHLIRKFTDQEHFLSFFYCTMQTLNNLNDWYNKQRRDNKVIWFSFFYLSNT